MDVFALPAHSAAALFPPMAAGEYAALVQSVADEGVLSPVIVWRGQVVDGVHRLRAARDCGLSAADVPVADCSGLEPAAMLGRVVAANIERRHLSASQRAAVADRLAAGSSWGGRRRGAGGSGDDVRVAAAAAACDVSPASVGRARRVRVNGAPELAAAVAGGEVSVAAAVRVMDVVPEPANQAAVLERWRDEGVAGRLGLGGDSGGIVSVAGHWVRDHQRAVQKPGRPGGEYGVVVIDPPWPLVTLPQIRGGEVGATYSSLSLAEIRERPPPVGAPGWVFLWCTDRHLWNARELLAAWNLEYGGMMVWAKNGGVKRPDGWTGNGEYVLLGVSDPPPAELVVIGRAGKPRYADTRRFFAVYPPLSATPAERAAWKRRGHSEKPDGFFALVERVCGNVSRLEMYARRPRPGWDVWGDQSGGGVVGVQGGG